MNRIAWLLIGVGLVVGIGSGVQCLRMEDRLRGELKLFALDCRAFAEANGRGPANLQELRGSRAANILNYPEVFRLVEEGRFKVIWNAVYDEIAAANDPAYLAYAADTPASGGKVLRADGSVQAVSAAEFAALRPLPAIRAAEPAAGGWKRYFSADNRCSAEFPARPRHGHQSLPGAAGDVITGDSSLRRLYLVRKEGGGVFAIVAVRIVGSGGSELFDLFRDKHLSNGDVKLISERDIVTANQQTPGRAVDLLVGADKVSLNRLFIHKGTLYRINVAIDRERRDDPDVRRFLDSPRFPPSARQASAP